MKPWWQVAIPHRDIREGRFDEAVFAAKLDEVLEERGPVDYRDPETFFRQTYPTGGLHQLVQTVARRLAGEGGEGVIQLQTPFGGGKTHGLLVLYHLFKHRDRVLKLDTVQDLLEEIGLESIPSAKVAAFVGTQADPQEGRTPWGELADQLGEYERVRVHDEKRVAPGKAVLRDLLERNSPVLVLIDELLEYVVKAAAVRVEEATLKGQVLAFLQELTETVSALPQVVLVLALPSSALERYDEAAEEMLTQLQRISGRVEAIYTPVEGVEIYEIIRRRLFEELGDAADQRRIVDDYFQLYQSLGDDLFSEARQVAYRERMVRAYPFHPELIDILFERWGTYASFQRTRGVLRLLARVVADLFEREHPARLIQPAHLNLHNRAIRREFIKHIGNQFEGVIAADIADETAKAELLDRDAGAEYRRFRVASSLATSIFFYSFSGGRVRGVGTPRLRLSFLRTGIPPAIVGDAMGRLEDELWYLHEEEGRYCFSAQPNLNRVLLDKQETVSEEAIAEETHRLAQDTIGKALAPYAFPSASRDIPDNKVLKLVLLSEQYISGARQTDSLLKELFERHGEGLRANKNTLLFLMMEEAGLRDVTQAVRRWLALRAIKDDKPLYKNLSEVDRKELDRRLEDAESNLPFKILSAYRILAKGTSEGFQIRDMGMPTVGEKSLSERARTFLEDEEMLLRQISPRYVQERLLGERQEMDYRTMADAFFTSPDNPILESEEVLKKAIVEGVCQRFFGLRVGEQVYFDEGVIPSIVTPETQIVSREVAEEWKRAEAERRREREGEVYEAIQEEIEGVGVREVVGEGEPVRVGKHAVRIALRIPWDKLAEFVTGVLLPLRSAGADIALRVELTAQSDDPIDPNVIDLKVRETLRQVGADVEEFEVE